jgi:glycosyltransferase involved in cell wall biosynthesis
LFESANDVDFVKKLEVMIINSNLRNQLSENLSNLIIEKYSKNSVVENLINIYKVLNT